MTFLFDSSQEECAVSFRHTWMNKNINGYGQIIESTSIAAHKCACGRLSLLSPWAASIRTPKYWK